jgi:site-specific DNA-methyltransferase (adenine-specific)
MMLAGLGFKFKEEIAWNKGYNSSPLTAIGRMHETVSISTKGNGAINRVKVPYLETKQHDISKIIADIKRLKTVFSNGKSLDAVLKFLENNELLHNEDSLSPSITVTCKEGHANGCCSVVSAIKNGMKEKTIIRTDLEKGGTAFKYAITGNSRSAGVGNRVVDVMRSISFGMKEKSLIYQAGERYNTIHPTQKPVRLLERLLALVTKEGDLVLDPFSGSASTAIAAYNTGKNFIGFEIDDEYYRLSIDRLIKTVKNA